MWCAVTLSTYKSAKSCNVNVSSLLLLEILFHQVVCFTAGQEFKGKASRGFDASSMYSHPRLLGPYVKLCPGGGDDTQKSKSIESLQKSRIGTSDVSTSMTRRNHVMLF